MAGGPLPPDRPLPAEPGHRPQCHRRGALALRVATSLPRAETAVHGYERRFRCEELFRDLKDQLHLETLRIALERPERVEKLLEGMMVLYYTLTFPGPGCRSGGCGRKPGRAG